VENYAAKQGIKVVYTGLGDYIDVASPSGRMKYEKAAFYDSVKDTLDEGVAKLLEDMKKLLAPTIGRWLMLNRGHHFWRFQDGTDTDKLLADYLKCPATDDMGMGITQVKFRNRRYTVSAEVWQWHGEGSSQTMAGPVNKLEREMLSWPTVDIFLMGHYSRAVGWPRDPLAPRFGKYPKLVAKRRILACTGAFDKGYTVNGRATYVERGGMPPLNHGGVLVYMIPEHRKDSDYLKLGVSSPSM